MYRVYIFVGNKQNKREIFQISEQQVVPPDSFEVSDATENRIHSTIIVEL